MGKWGVSLAVRPLCSAWSLQKSGPYVYESHMGQETVLERSPHYVGSLSRGVTVSRVFSVVLFSRTQVFQRLFQFHCEHTRWVQQYELKWGKACGAMNLCVVWECQTISIHILIKRMLRNIEPKCGKNSAIMALPLTIGLRVVRRSKHVLDT